MDNIRIVDANEENARFLFELMNDAFLMDVLNEVPTTIDVWIDAIKEWKQDSDEEDYIIFDDIIPIGWVGINGLSAEEKKAYIKMIVLLPRYQNKGIGRYVIGKIIERLKWQGYLSVGLYTDQCNIKAQHCYLKCGFKVIDEVEQKMSNGAVVKRYKMEREV